jgi:hypothetical protein
MFADRIVLFSGVGVEQHFKGKALHVVLGAFEEFAKSGLHV